MKTIRARWDPIVNDVSKLLKAFDALLPSRLDRAKRGRKPKHSLKAYLKLICLKEAKKASLRGAEVDYSKLVCGARVDHSVIRYWEKRLDKELIQALVAKAGN